MGSESIFYNKQVMQQDMDAYVAAVKINDFREANIFANRIMSNASLSNVQNYGILGHILKEIANDGMFLQQGTDKTVLTNFSKEYSKLIAEMLTMVKNDKIDFAYVWSFYATALAKNRDVFMTKNEKLAYKKMDTDFSFSVVTKLRTILDQNRNWLLYPSNNLLRGILNETTRLVKNHGLPQETVHYVSILIMLSRIDDYIKATSVVDEFPDRITKELMPLVEKSIAIFNDINEYSKNIDKFNDVLWELIKLWRLYFIRFMEIGSSIQLRQEKIAEEPVKSKLVDAITREIEKEIGKE